MAGIGCSPPYRHMDKDTWSNSVIQGALALRSPAVQLAPRPLKRHLVVLERPLHHVADAAGANAVNDELGVVDAPQVLPEERVRLPNLLEHGPVGHDLGIAR